MRKGLFLALTLIAVNLSLLATDRDIALVYQEQISKHVATDPILAEQLLERALTFSQDLSGLWFYRGTLLIRNEELSAAEEALDKALLVDDWEGAPYDEFLTTYLSLLERMGRYDKLLDMVDTIGFHRINYNQVLLSSGWAYFSLDRIDEAWDVANKGRQLYPEDPHFYTLALACKNDPLLVNSYLHYFGNRGKTLYETVYRLTKLDSLPSEVKERFIKSSSAPFSLFLQLWDSLGSNRSENSMKVNDFLSDNTFTDLGLLLELYSRCDDEGKSVIDRYILETDANFYLDRDGDFYPEVTLSEMTLLFDRDRDGQFESEILLSTEGVPTNWVTKSLEQKREIVFDLWPFIEQINLSFGGTLQKFHYLYPYLSLSESGIPENITVLDLVVDFLENDLKIPLEMMLHSSYSIEEEKEGHPYRFSYVVNGEIVGINEDSSGDGRYNRQILFENGEIIAARRDLEGDGKYDLFEFYKKGVWKGYAINLNGGTWSDFYEDWSLLSIKIWDYRGDNLVSGYSVSSLEGEQMIIRPQVEDIMTVDDLLYWEKKFEAQWYR